MVLAWSERTKHNYTCSGKKNCCYAHNLMTEYQTKSCWFLSDKSYNILVHVSKQVEVICSIYYTIHYKISKWSRSFTAQSMFQEGTIFLEFWKWSILCRFESMLQLLLENIINLFNWCVYLQNGDVNNKMSVPYKFIISCHRLERWDDMLCNGWYSYLIYFIYYAFHFW